MGTLALGRFARWTGDPEALAAAERNLDYQLRTFYRAQPDGSAVIEHGGSAKLGAAAIAGLALLEAPSTPERADALGRLARGIELLWRPSGAFRTFTIRQTATTTRTSIRARQPSSGRTSMPANATRWC